MLQYSVVISDGTFPCDTAPIQGTLGDCFSRAREAGFDAVQLTARKPSELRADELRALMDAYGLRITAIATGRMYSADRLSMGSSDEGNRLRCVDGLCRFADLSAQLGRPAVIIGTVRGRLRDAVSATAYYAQFERSVRELAAYCEKLGVPVILEAIDRFEADAYCDPEEVRRFVERVGSPALSMYLDTLHLHNEGFRVADAIRAYGRHSRQIDLGGEGHSALAQSKLDFKDIAAAVRESGFDGVLNLEHKPSPPDGAAKSLAYFRSLLSVTG